MLWNLHIKTNALGVPLCPIILWGTFLVWRQANYNIPPLNLWNSESMDSCIPERIFVFVHKIQKLDGSPAQVTKSLR